MEKKLLMSGDIELNPGPVENSTNETSTTIPPHVRLEQRLRQFQLTPFDVGGAGDCFFRAVSHQLHGDPGRHLDIRAAGIAYMRENPERFIESNTECSWLQYLNNMSMQGTWCDGLIIQAVADQLNLRIAIAESHEHFRQFSFIQAVSPTQRPTDILLGHIDEYHYISTVPFSASPNSSENQEIDLQKIETNILTNLLLDDNIHNFKKASSPRDKKNAYMKEYMKRKRSTEDPQSKQKRNDQKKEYMKGKRSTEDSQSKQKLNYCNKEYMKRKQSESVNRSIESLIFKFHNIVSQGPLYICTCCDQLWYKHSVLPAATLKKTNPAIGKKILHKTSVDNIEWLCRLCHNYLVKNKVPPCAAINGMQFTVKPTFFDLNELECRLLAPRLAFQKLMQAPRGRQLKINGNIVNVSADISNTISMLPRLPDEIKVNLKRKLQYKSSALSLNVRPHKVVQAANWLLNNSSLYREEGITFNPNWLNNYPNGLLPECEDNIQENKHQSKKKF